MTRVHFLHEFVLNLCFLLFEFFHCQVHLGRLFFLLVDSQQLVVLYQIFVQLDDSCLSFALSRVHLIRICIEIMSLYESLHHFHQRLDLLLSKSFPPVSRSRHQHFFRLLILFYYLYEFARLYSKTMQWLSFIVKKG